MTEHGKIHTDGSRTGGQPVTNNKSAVKDIIDRWYDSEVRPPTQSDALAEVGTKGKYVHDGFELACRVTAHIEGWLEVELKGDNSPAVIRPSRFVALEQTK